MRRGPFVRWGWAIALAAGLAWILPLIVGRLSPDPDSWDCNSFWDYVLNALDPVTFFMTAAAMWALYAAQPTHSRVIVLKWATVAGVVGAIGAGVNNPIEHCADVDALGLALWVPAILLWLLGLFVVGALTLEGRILPRWTGLAVLAGVVGLFVLKEDGSAISIGVAWMVVSLALWRSRRPTPQTATLQ